MSVTNCNLKPVTYCLVFNKHCVLPSRYLYSETEFGEGKADILVSLNDLLNP